MKEKLQAYSPELFSYLKRGRYYLRRLNPFISSRFVYIGRGLYYDIEERRGISTLRPNCFVIGAEKAGTTSLHHYLDQHPDIFMTKPNKEPHYLLPLNYVRTYFEKSDIPIRDKRDLLKNHMLRGYQGQPIIGESTTAYTRGTTDTKHTIPQKIKRLGPDTRVIYIMRHPIHRIVSSYRHRRNLGLTTKSITDDLRTLKAYVYTGMYGRHAEAFLKHVQPEQVHFMFYEEFIEQPEKELAKVFTFLGQDSVSVDTSTVFNSSGGEFVELAEKDRQRLATVFKSDVQKLEKILDRKTPWEF